MRHRTMMKCGSRAELVLARLRVAWGSFAGHSEACILLDSFGSRLRSFRASSSPTAQPQGSLCNGLSPRSPVPCFLVASEFPLERGVLDRRLWTEHIARRAHMSASHFDSARLGYTAWRIRLCCVSLWWLTPEVQKRYAEPSGA